MTSGFTIHGIISGPTASFDVKSAPQSRRDLHQRLRASADPAQLVGGGAVELAVDDTVSAIEAGVAVGVVDGVHQFINFRTARIIMPK